MPLLLQSSRVSNSLAVYQDIVFVHTTDATTLGLPADGSICGIGEGIFWVRADVSAPIGSFCSNTLQRVTGKLRLDIPYEVTPLSPESIPNASMMTWEVVKITSPSTPVILDGDGILAAMRVAYSGHVYRQDQQIAMFAPLVGGDGTLVEVILRLVEVTTETAATSVRLGEATELIVRRASSLPPTVTVNYRYGSRASAPPLFVQGFSFEDVGVGGLDKEFQAIVRRAFASRMVPPRLLAQLGQKHIRGMLLYGPPGCGKTLIARQIGKMLRAHPPKIVNGPELLNKYVGESEANIRALFAEAEKEQAEKGDDSSLHIIILDELDALVKRRGTTSGGTGVNDNVVNQFLSKIDGVEALNNILIIGMTNRRDMLDEALLRPGRLELQVEIGLPTCEGRRQILDIHTAEARRHGALAADISLDALAERTRNYTGAEIEGLVRAACSNAFAKRIDLRHDTQNFEGLTVGTDDFERALLDVRPAFGTRDEELSVCLGRTGLVDWGCPWRSFQESLEEVIAIVAVRTTSVLLEGPPRSGKTAIAAETILKMAPPFSRRLAAGDLLALPDDMARIAHINALFADARRSPVAAIILDDLERLIQWSPVGARYNNSVLQALLVNIGNRAMAGCRLLLLGTTAVPSVMRELGLQSAFEQHVTIPMPSQKSEFQILLEASKSATCEDWLTDAAEYLAKNYPEGMVVGRVLAVADAPTLSTFLTAVART